MFATIAAANKPIPSSPVAITSNTSLLDRAILRLRIVVTDLVDEFEISEEHCAHGLVGKPFGKSMEIRYRGKISLRIT